MAEAFRNWLGPKAVAQGIAHLAAAAPALARYKLEREATGGLETLELKGRALHVAEVLERHLPKDFPLAAEWVRSALAPVRGDEDLKGLGALEGGLCGWFLWPVGLWVERRGLEHPREALALLREITMRFTAEWSIRPFLEAHRELTLEHLAAWVQDPSHHVRRLVSEGSRPRLPWGKVLRFLVEDPSPTLPLLERLLDDPSAYVRRSVANHLNDVAKDHPSTLVEFLRSHLQGASPERRALLRHASRTAIKSGDKAVLAAFGLGAALRGEAQFSLAPRRVSLGNSLTLTATIRSTARKPQALEIDYAIHFQGASGQRAPKVFKGWKRTLAPGEQLELHKQHSLRPITTRRYYPGEHPVDLLVNGRTVASASFRLAPGPK